MLDQVVSASAAERNWSLYDKIKTQDRNRLGHAKGDKLVYCHEALHLRKKLQKAGYSAGYKAKVETLEKSDSDSDSDDQSDDDKDLMA